MHVSCILLRRRVADLFKHLDLVFKNGVLFFGLLLAHLELFHNLLKLIYLLIQLIFLLSHHFNFLLLVLLLQGRQLWVGVLVVRPVERVLRVRDSIELPHDADLVKQPLQLIDSVFILTDTLY